ncbi:MAG: hypothetical protein V7K41_29950 [Nostoc sp.]|uniref:hypothetical protein n=1 Tax=Nostoc sp. TaxID=1180 RepID=UPI002FF85D30
MRCKFEVTSLTRYAGIPSVKVELHPAMGQDEEDRKFWKITPTGKIELMIDDSNNVNYFEVGKEYYLDFSEVENVR